MELTSEHKAGIGAIERLWRQHLEQIWEPNDKEMIIYQVHKFAPLFVFEGNTAIGKVSTYRFGGVMQATIFLDPISRGRGTGSEVLAKLEDIARKEGDHMLEIIADVDCRVMDFYQKKGYSAELVPNYYYGHSVCFMRKNF